MKNLYLVLVMLTASNLASAVCTTPISRSNFSAYQVLTSTALNSQLNTAYTQLNELPGDCVTNETITSAKILNGTIVNADISASAAIASSKLAAVNYQISGSSGAFVTVSSSAVDVTNLSVTITTTGRPVEIYLVPESGSLASSVEIYKAATTSMNGELNILRGASSISRTFLNIQGASGLIKGSWPVSSFRYFDPVPAGTYTYKVQVNNGAGSENIGVNYCKLVVREL